MTIAIIQADARRIPLADATVQCVVDHAEKRTTHVQRQFPRL